MARDKGVRLPSGMGGITRYFDEAISKVKNGPDTVELSPQSAYIRRLQHLIAERNDLSSQSTGKEPNRKVRIYKAD